MQIHRYIFIYTHTFIYNFYNKRSNITHQQTPTISKVCFVLSRMYKVLPIFPSHLKYVVIIFLLLVFEENWNIFCKKQAVMA